MAVTPGVNGVDGGAKGAWAGRESPPGAAYPITAPRKEKDGFPRRGDEETRSGNTEGASANPVRFRGEPGSGVSGSPASAHAGGPTMATFRGQCFAVRPFPLLQLRPLALTTISGQPPESTGGPFAVGEIPGRLGVASRTAERVSWRLPRLLLPRRR